MAFSILQISFLIFIGTAGFLISQSFFSNTLDLILSTLMTLLFGGGVLFAEKKLRKVNFRTIISGVLGLVVGLVVAKCVSYSFLRVSSFKQPYSFLRLFINSAFPFLGFSIGIRRGEHFDIETVSVLFRKNKDIKGNFKILDTSVIIDGRISDICKSGFLEGTFIIPQFVVHELQQIADSSDSLKRSRGREGLDFLNRIRKQSNIEVKIVENDYPNISSVDDKLVELAKELKGSLITNDFNLNKVASLYEVNVLNVNELANALKPLVLPGETMEVLIQREGKEHNQGVAYLDDGTMIVVDNARQSIGNNVEISVTTVLQTDKGRMIFGKLKGQEQTTEPYSYAHTAADA